MPHLRCWSIAVFFIACMCFFLSSPGWADWVPDGSPVCTNAGDQEYPTAVSDGAGGAIIAWNEYRPGTGEDIYAQRVGASGNVTWTAGGIALCAAVGDQWRSTLASDGAGGAIVTWIDYRNGNWDIYAQRVNSSGVALWASGGVPLCTATDLQYAPRIVPDGAGGAVVSWYDRRTGDYDVYVQRVNSSGVVQWTPNGVALCTVAMDQYYHTIAADGSGGAIVTWEDYRNGTDYNIYAQRVDGTGTVQWTADGVALCTASMDQSTPRIVADGAGGAIVTWIDFRAANNDIYAQRIDAIGAPQWTADGVALCTDVNSQQFPPGSNVYNTIASDGAGGAIVTWTDHRSGTYSDIYAQRVTSSGIVQWTTDGVGVCTANQFQSGATIVSDGSSGAIVTWSDWRSGSNYDIYGQRVDASGINQWAVGGVPLCTAAGDQGDGYGIQDGAGGAIVIWTDQRAVDNDIYAQRVTHQGVVLGNLVPVGMLAMGIVAVALGALGIQTLRRRGPTLAG